MTKYLLDVSSLIALGLVRHNFHHRMSRWIQSQSVSRFLTCSITELGFVRIASQPEVYGFTIDQARRLLLELKSATTFKFEFVVDDHDISELPSWVKSSSQTTDGHLAQLATAHGAVLATFDAKIPGTYLIP
jgi:uncharacterized protein